MNDDNKPNPSESSSTSPPVEYLRYLHPDDSAMISYRGWSWGYGPNSHGEMVEPQLGEKWEGVVDSMGFDGSIKWIADRLDGPFDNEKGTRGVRIESVSLNGFREISSGSNGKAKNSLGLRNIMIDVDDKNQVIKPLEFLGALRSTGIPISYCVASGKKGIHAVICLNEIVQRGEEADRICNAIFEALQKNELLAKYLDPAPLCGDLKYTVRVRLPGIFREETGKEHELILPWQGRVSKDTLEAWLTKNLKGWLTKKTWVIDKKLKKSPSMKGIINDAKSRSVQLEGLNFVVNDKGIFIPGAKDSLVTYSPIRLPIISEISIVDVNGRPKQVKYGIKSNDSSFELTADQLTDGKELSRILNVNLGVTFSLTANAAIKQINIEKSISSPAKIVRRTHAGYYDQNGETVYITGRLRISKAEIAIAENVLIETDEKSKSAHLGMAFEPTVSTIPVWRDGVLGALLNLKERPTTVVTMVSALIPLVADLIREKPPIIIVHGASGSLKTTFIRYVMCLYGNFNTDGTMISATSTPNALEKEAHAFRGCPVPIDDIKLINIPNPSRFMSVFQNYYDGTAKDRLNSSAESKGSYVIYGIPFLSAEDHPWPTSESLAGRSFVIPWDPGFDIDASNLVRAHLKQFNTLLPHFIQHLLRQEKLRESFDRCSIRGIKESPGVGNELRVTNSIILLKFTFELLLGFFCANGIIEDIERFKLQKDFDEGIRKIGEHNRKQLGASSAGLIFMETLKELLARSEVIIQWGGAVTEPPNPNKSIVGFVSDHEPDKVVLYPGACIAEVVKALKSQGHTIPFTTETVFRDLKKTGEIIEWTEGQSFKWVKNNEGRRIRGWVTSTSALGLATPGFLLNSNSKYDIV